MRPACPPAAGGRRPRRSAHLAQPRVPRAATFTPGCAASPDVAANRKAIGTERSGIEAHVTHRAALRLSWQLLPSVRASAHRRPAAHLARVIAKPKPPAQPLALSRPGRHSTTEAPSPIPRAPSFRHTCEGAAPVSACSRWRKPRRLRFLAWDSMDLGNSRLAIT